MKLEFAHLQSAHCENGVTTNLLRHHGLDWMTEPLAFGMGAGLFYIWIPLLKVNNGPAIAFRGMPGSIFRTTCRSLGMPIRHQRFRSPAKAEAALDAMLDQGKLVGCQVGVYYLPYFPKEYRFHFNAHNLIVFGREGDEYLVSDPVMESATRISRSDLSRVRFARGAMPPNGHMYYVEKGAPVNDETIRKAIHRGIRRNVRNMLHIPGYFAGVSGLRYTGRKIRRWRDSLGLEKAGLYLAQIVRMQEEIGTGGGGFRYIYGAFLEQAYPYLRDDSLLQASRLMTQSGDRLRDTAVLCSGIYKGKYTEQADFDRVADLFSEVADIEQQAFRILSKMKQA